MKEQGDSLTHYLIFRGDNIIVLKGFLNIL